MSNLRRVVLCLCLLLSLRAVTILTLLAKRDSKPVLFSVVATWINLDTIPDTTIAVLVEL